MTETGRLRVVYLGHVARLSGGELALLHTLTALPDRVDPLVVLAEDGPLVDRLREEGIQTRVLPLGESVRDLRKEVAVTGLSPRRALSVIRYVLQLRRLLRELRPDLVHTNSLKAALYGGFAGRLAGVPVLWHVRDRISEDYLPRKVVLLVRLACSVLPSAVVANSTATLATLPQSGRSSRLRGVSPNSVVAESILHDSVASRPAFAERSSEDQLMIGMAGRLSPWKGQDLFLRAFAQAFRGQRVQAVLIGSALFGEDEYAASLAPLTRELGIEGQVEFRGFRPNMWAEYARLDMLVHCSLVPEPFGQVVLEGMAAGLCVLAADEGGPVEIVIDGVNGILVPPRDERALASAMATCAADKGLRMRLGAGALVRSKDFSPEATAARVVGIYDRMLRQRQGRLRRRGRLGRAVRLDGHRPP